jgi:hypothetical protein
VRFHSLPVYLSSEAVVGGGARRVSGQRAGMMMADAWFLPITFWRSSTYCRWIVVLQCWQLVLTIVNCVIANLLEQCL